MENKSINLKELLSKVLQLPIERIKGNIGAETCSQWDSISHIDIIARLEKELSEDIPTEEVGDLDSFISIKTFLENKGWKTY